jgi:hypothetical protein
MDDVQGLVHRSLCIKGETSVDLGRHLARNDRENLFAKLD